MILFRKVLGKGYSRWFAITCREELRVYEDFSVLPGIEPGISDITSHTLPVTPYSRSGKNVPISNRYPVKYSIILQLDTFHIFAKLSPFHLKKKKKKRKARNNNFILCLINYEDRMT